MKKDLSRRRMLQATLVPAALASAQAEDLSPTVSRVYPGSDGKLVYVPDGQGNTILDSSHAGYAGGGTAGPGPAAGGRGGAPGGGFGGGKPTLIRIAGSSGWAAKDETRQLVTDDYVPVGSRKITLASARDFRPGDTVIVRRIGNQDWIDAMGMNGKEYPQDNWRSPFNVDWDRVVTNVQGSTITLDAPITCAIEKKWGGGEVTKYEDPGRIERCGVENIRGMSEFDPTVRRTQYGNMDRPNYAPEEYYADENHWSNLILFDNLKHGWVRNCTALHFVYSMGQARHAPVTADCHSLAEFRLRRNQPRRCGKEHFQKCPLSSYPRPRIGQAGWDTTD